MGKHGLIRIVSGGQTGVDRAGLDAAMFLAIPHGGWCPRGRRAEDGAIPLRYHLQEMPQRDYAVRTEQNVVDSDGTLILYRDRLSGGTELTFRLTKKHRRPCLCVDLNQLEVDDGDFEKSKDESNMLSANLLRYLEESNIQVLNIAGPRESTSPGIAQQAERFLVLALA